MKLSKLQIEEINLAIKTKIYYYDIRSELVDHLASSIEHEISENDDSFKITLEKAMANLDLNKSQSQILFSQHLSSIKNLFIGWLLPSHICWVLLVICVSFFLIQIGVIAPNQTYLSFSIVMSIVITAPFLNGIFKKQMLYHSEFLSNINSLFLIYVSMSFLFDLAIENFNLPKEIFLPILIGILSGQMLIGIRLISKTYKKINLAFK
ncbi:hypothetical protein P872_25405 [Rhodonellum psychrophilum GCM71 = DSM 17998]|uniref:Uncharacterized protein n=2 Tax=Rhodonellum TaxID=336827 RepID=U5C6C5_9BACT|nr:MULTISPECIES: hypothetical protein [Rhodonellum]ERM84496.1 hypothetical protein P872_25405 [Rhodonellum psychrophilum GCM71 = DSM 17998]SDZ01450.1 hypothetical protein SAMN05444412_104311 [Rhodonellum ikkaensis]